MWVFQGASVAFDLSMEEIWVPYLVGATLFVASPAMMGDVEALPDILTQNRVTVPRHGADAARHAVTDAAERPPRAAGRRGLAGAPGRPLGHGIAEAV